MQKKAKKKTYSLEKKAEQKYIICLRFFLFSSSSSLSIFAKCVVFSRNCWSVNHCQYEPLYRIANKFYCMRCDSLIFNIFFPCISVEIPQSHSLLINNNKSLFIFAFLLPLTIIKEIIIFLLFRFWKRLEKENYISLKSCAVTWKIHWFHHHNYIILDWSNWSIKSIHLFFCSLFLLIARLHQFQWLPIRNGEKFIHFISSC